MTSFDDLRTFIALVSKKWWGVVAAMTVATTLLWLLRPDFPFSMLPGFFWLVSCLLLVIATFQVWREQHLRLQRLEHQDADIRLEPMQGEKAVEFKLPRSYQLFKNLVPPEIDLLISFEIVNRGGKSGSLLNMYPEEHKWGAEPDIQFRQSGLYAYHEEHGWDRSQVSLPESFQPDERRKVSYRLHARIEVPTPERFAELLRKLTDSALEFTWSFRDEGETQEGKTSVDVSFDKLKQYVYSTWEAEKRTDLTEIAQLEAPSPKGGS